MGTPQRTTTHIPIPLRVARCFLWLAVVLWTGTSLAGGQTYTWCEPMHQALLRPCCPPGAHHHVEERRESRVEALPCCQVRRVDASAPSTPLPDALVPTVPPPVLAWVSLLALPTPTPARAPATLNKARGRAHPARAGPTAAVHALHCVYLC
jgi:hypothetical protein